MLDTLGKRKVFPETKEVLCSLIFKYKIYIGSNTDTRPLILGTKRNNIKVNGIFTSEDLKSYKPDAEFYRSILKIINLNPNKVLFVGDSITDDIIGPKNIGMDTCFVNRKSIDTTDVEATYVIKNLQELITLML